jgi:hypothetical protein
VENGNSAARCSILHSASAYQDAFRLEMAREGVVLHVRESGCPPKSWTVSTHQFDTLYSVRHSLDIY